MTGKETPFSFHCMICFEEFHPEDRYPVVLPCGHTYVCNCCANRLDRCMECRTPLYELVPHANNKVPAAPMNSASWSSARPGQLKGRSQDNPPPQPPMKRRLALPKNVVLLSLIEATELASEDARRKYTESPRRSRDSFDGATYVTGPSIPDLQSKGSMLDVEDEEEEKIKISTSLAVGVAGTYAVAAKEGLQILPSRPSNKESKDGPLQEEDVEILVRGYHFDQANSSKDEELDAMQSLEKLRIKKDSLKLCYGDRIQVVSVDGNWAKLARGYGFVRAEKNQLVKGKFSKEKSSLAGSLLSLISYFLRVVGGAVDRACKLEAMLCSLSNRRKELRFEQSKIDNQFIRFMNELEHSLQNDEDLTVILADTFSAPVENSKNDFVKVQKEEKKNSSDEESYGYPQKPLVMRSPTPPVETFQGGRFTCFAGDVFGDDGGDTEETTNLFRSSWSNPETVVLQGLSQDSEVDPSRLFPASSHPSPSAMRAGAQAWREQHGRTAAHGGGINFRTGMSGHMALLSTHAHAHEYLEPSWSGQPSTKRISSGRMSSHTGLTMPKMPTLNGILSSLTLPLMGSPQRQENSQGQIHHTGSM